MSIGQKIKERIIRELFRTYSYPKKNIVDDLITGQPFDFSPKWREAMLSAMRHGLEHHTTHSAFYGRLCRHKGFAPNRLKSFDDIWDIPFILQDVFKSFRIETRTPDPFRTEISSSGTSGRRSTILLDTISGQRLLFSTYHIYKALGMVDERPANYMLMAYDPQIDDTVATTNSDVIISHFTPRKNIFYALKSNKNGEVEFSRDLAAERLREYVADGAPIRIVGFMHHTLEAIAAYRNRYGRVNFPDGSCILSGGGWKNFGHLYSPGFDLFKFLKESTNIEPSRVRDLYTLTEHPVFYLECEERNMHVPNVSLACVRDPRTLKVLPDGKKGLVHLYTPIIESTPILSLLTTDYGYTGRSCGCPIGGPYLKIIGRAGVTKRATCTLTAEQYIKPSRRQRPVRNLSEAQSRKALSEGG